jgi:heme-binding protein
MKIFRWFLLGILLALIVMQFVPVERTNPPVEQEVPAPANVRAMLRRACYDCHSNETRWPWYSHVAPVSWLVAHDVFLDLEPVRTEAAGQEVECSLGRGRGGGDAALVLPDGSSGREAFGRGPRAAARVGHGDACGQSVTAQIHERLILDGEETSMAFCPPLPDGHPRISASDSDEAGEDERFILHSTACWRGYQGTWEISDGRLYLVALRGRLQLRGGEPLLADWFSGILRVPRGEIIEYVHMGFGSVHEQEVHIKIENGMVVTRRVIDNRGKQHDKWEIGWRNLPGCENRFPGDNEL